MLSRISSIYKESFKGLSSSIWLLSSVTLINRSGTMVVPFMSMYITQSLHYSLTQAGFVLTCFGLGAVIGALIGGKLSDIIGHHKVQLLTLFFGGVSFVILGQMREYNSICIMTFILALTNEAFRPANMASIAAYSTPENRARSVSLIRLATNLGWAVGASLGGLLASINYHLLFWVDSITNISAAVCLYFFLKPTQQNMNEKRIPAQQKESVYKDKYYLYFIVLAFFFALCFFQIFSTYPVFLKKEMLLQEHHIGWLFAFNGLLIAFFEMPIINSLSGKRNELSYISLGLILLGFSFLILNISTQLTLTLAFTSCLLFTIGEMLTMPFMMSFWMHRSNERNRGQYASLYTVAYSSAHITGPLIGGLIVDQFGFWYLWIAILIVCLLNSLLFKILRDRIPTVLSKV